MAEFLFTSGTSRGAFTAVEADGERRDCIGVDIVLGIETGETAKEALTELLTKLSQSHALPEYLYQHRNIVVYKISGSDWINHTELLKHATKEAEEELKTEPLKTEGGYQEVTCKWCGKTLPSNGGPQFAHLQKHLRQLLKAKLITDEQYRSIHTTTLTKEFEEILLKAKEAGITKK